MHYFLSIIFHKKGKYFSLFYYCEMSLFIQVMLFWAKKRFSYYYGLLNKKSFTTSILIIMEGPIICVINLGNFKIPPKARLGHNKFPFPIHGWNS